MTLITALMTFSLGLQDGILCLSSKSLQTLDSTSKKEEKMKDASLDHLQEKGVKVKLPSQTLHLVIKLLMNCLITPSLGDERG